MLVCLKPWLGTNHVLLGFRRNERKTLDTSICTHFHGIELTIKVTIAFCVQWYCNTLCRYITTDYIFSFFTVRIFRRVYSNLASRLFNWRARKSEPSQNKMVALLLHCKFTSPVSDYLLKFCQALVVLGHFCFGIGKSLLRPTDCVSNVLPSQKLLCFCTINIISVSDFLNSIFKVHQERVKTTSRNHCTFTIIPHYPRVE